MQTLNLRAMCIPMGLVGGYSIFYLQFWREEFKFNIKFNLFSYHICILLYINFLKLCYKFLKFYDIDRAIAIIYSIQTTFYNSLVEIIINIE